MIILLYSAAVLIETILLVNYLRLRSVEVRLPEPCSMQSCKIFEHKQQIIRTLVILYFKDQLTVLF